MKKSNNKKTRDVTAFIYPRLSRDDNLEGESYSISNQKKLLTNGEWVQKLTIYYNCVGALFIPDTPSMPVPDVTVNTRRGVYVSYEPAQNRQ